MFTKQTWTESSPLRVADKVLTFPYNFFIDVIGGGAVGEGQRPAFVADAGVIERAGSRPEAGIFRRSMLRHF